MKKTDNMNNPIEELRRMEVPVTEEEWTSIVNDKRYVQKFGRKPGLSPKGRAGLVAGIAAVLITVPILVKTLGQQPAEQAQPAAPATEVAAPQPAATPTATTTTVARSTSVPQTTTTAAVPETKPTVTVTSQAATHEGSTMASVIEKRQTNPVPTVTVNKAVPTPMTTPTATTKPAETKSITEKPMLKPTIPTITENTPSENIFTDDEAFKSYEPETTAEEAEQFFIPSAFTPNGDGLNDIFYVTANFEPKHFTMYIFNRAGQLLFTTTDMRIGWDGTLYGSFLPNDVYVYLIKYIDRNGDEQQRRGQLLLLP
jgi:gliding motility-associated-like protein